MCSGAMINNTANDNTQYLLSANHCYESGTWKFYFRYQATTCNGSDGNTLRTATGYTLMAKDDGDSSSDFMLVKINGTINASYDVYLAGWDCTATTPTNATSCGAIHHPGGDIKKFSVPQNIYNGTSAGSQYSKFWLANWATATGATEQGSSGSPLFNKKGLIVGQLYAGSSSCSNPTGWDIYGKLSNSWTNNNNSSNAKKLKPWLDPTNSGVNTLQGRWMNNAPSGIAEESNIGNLKVFPNPTTGMITVSGNFNNGDGICNVYDMMGNLVLSKNVNLSSEITLNLSSLTVGMYMVEISDNTYVFRSKIIISK